MKLGYWIITIYMVLILLGSLILNIKKPSLNNYHLYHMHMLIRQMKSKILTNYICIAILKFKKQERKEPKIIKQPFSNRC